MIMSIGNIAAAVSEVMAAISTPAMKQINMAAIDTKANVIIAETIAETLIAAVIVIAIAITIAGIQMIAVM